MRTLVGVEAEEVERIIKQKIALVQRMRKLRLRADDVCQRPH